MLFSYVDRRSFIREVIEQCAMGRPVEAYALVLPGLGGPMG